MVVRGLWTILICFAVAAIAGEACASICVPKVVLELSAADVLSAADESGATAASTGGSQDPGPSVPRVPFDEIRRLALAAYAGSLGSGNSSNMGGSSSPSFGSGSSTLAVASTTGFHVDDTLVGWLSQSGWLDIPMPPGTSLLRPPQAV